VTTAENIALEVLTELSADAGTPHRPKPLLIGEANPYSGNPKLALFPWPASSAGGRLCRVVLGLAPRQYIRWFDRVNLCAGEWNAREAREAAKQIFVDRFKPERVNVLLGAKVARAFGYDFEPFLVERGSCGSVVILPHPSGRCRTWNEPGAVDRAREALRKSGLVLP